MRIIEASQVGHIMVFLKHDVPLSSRRFGDSCSRPVSSGGRRTGSSGCCYAMKLNLHAGFAVLLGLATARFTFYLTDWSYHVFRDPFNVGKMAVELGVPVTATMIWFWILRVAFKSRSK